MTLRTYPHPVKTYLVTPAELNWVYGYVAAAAALSQGKMAPGKAKQRGKYTAAYKLGCIAFARLFNLSDQLGRHVEKVSSWSLDYDFVMGKLKIRVVTTPLSEDFAFGPNVSARVWEHDMNKPASIYVLAGWFCPWVDIIGWTTREKLRTYKEKNYYNLTTMNVTPMNDMPWLKG